MNTNGMRSPKKQKQRVNHSSGEPSLNAEDGRVGSEASSWNSRNAAEADAPHLPSAACAGSRTNEPPDHSRTLKIENDDPRTALPLPIKQRATHSSGKPARVLARPF